MSNELQPSDFASKDRREIIKAGSLSQLVDFFREYDLKVLDDILCDNMGFPKMSIFLDSNEMGGPAIMILQEGVPAAGTGPINREGLISYLETGLEEEWTARESREIKPLLQELKSWTEEQLFEKVKAAINTDEHYSKHFLVQ